MCLIQSLLFGIIASSSGLGGAHAASPPVQASQLILTAAPQTAPPKPAATADSRPTANVLKPQSADPYEYRADHDPNGTGKFHLGREIAQVMGHQAADWLDRPERQKEERPDLLHAALGLKPGMSAADIGAGTGFHTLRMAEKVGPAGRVFAVEIQREMLDALERRARGQGLTNIVPVLGAVTNPGLTANSLDLALMVDVYHEFSHPFEMAREITAALKPGGRLVFVEFRGEDASVPIKAVHKMTESQVRLEMAPFELEWVETVRTLPWQHIIVFRKNHPLPKQKNR